MNHEVRPGALGDYVDGVLDATERARIDQHLEGCPRCRLEVESLRALTRAARALPRTLDPEQDLWPDLLDRLGGHRRPRLSRGGPVWLRGALAAAAAVAVLWAGARLVPGPPRSGREGPAVRDPNPAMPEIVVLTDDARPRSATWASMIWALEEQNLGATKVFMTTMAGAEPAAVARVGGLGPGLRALDLAIDETAEALRRDPENPELARTLAHYYDRKLELLRRAVRIASGTLT